MSGQAHQRCVECHISLAAAARSDARPPAMMSHSPKRRQAMRVFRAIGRGRQPMLMQNMRDMRLMY